MKKKIILCIFLIFIILSSLHAGFEFEIGPYISFGFSNEFNNLNYNVFTGSDIALRYWWKFADVLQIGVGMRNINYNFTILSFLPDISYRLRLSFFEVNAHFNLQIFPFISDYESLQSKDTILLVEISAGVFLFDALFIGFSGPCPISIDSDIGELGFNIKIMYTQKI